MFKFRSVPSKSILATTYMRCTVSATDSGSPVNPTTGTVEFAFLTNESNPASGDWHAGVWETAGDEYLGRILLGPNGTYDLAVATYNVWIRVVYSGETVVENIGEFYVY